MLVVDPTRRATLSELLRSGCLQVGKSTIEKRQYLLLGLFCCPKGKRHPHFVSHAETRPLGGEWFEDPDLPPQPQTGKWLRLDRLSLEVDMRRVTDALPIGTREILPAARFPDDLFKALSGPSRIYPRVLQISGHGLKHGLVMESAKGEPLVVTIDRSATPTLGLPPARCPLRHGTLTLSTQLHPLALSSSPRRPHPRSHPHPHDR